MEFVLLIALVFLFVPGIIAKIRNHNNLLAICVLNLIVAVVFFATIISAALSSNMFAGLAGVFVAGQSFLDWAIAFAGLAGVFFVAGQSFLGWAIALVWACTKDVDTSKQTESYEPYDG